MSFSSRRRFLAATGRLTGAGLLAANVRSFGMSAGAQTGAPAGAPDAYAKPKPMIAGPFEPTWESLRDKWQVPAWFNEAKFGIFIHWGLYSIPARINEWYERHMYTSDAKWHTEHYGSPDKFGYKDFIPMFTAKKYDPEQWAELFQNAGARYVVPVAEHHDGFAMWDSEITPWCAGKMGPKRDLTGELAKAVKKRNMVFGVSSHRIEHDAFAYPAKGVPNDEFDPKYAGFYGPPIHSDDFNNSDGSPAFQGDWLARIQELVDKYEPQMIYLDNGINGRPYDDIKLKAAAYYYNSAAKWGKQVTMATKDVAYLFGSVQDFEKQQRAPKWIYNAPGWQVDDALCSTWGYTESPQPMTVRGADSIAREMMELASMRGNLLLNVSPMGDGSIPENQQRQLLAFGEWMKTNGEAIHGSRPWVRMGEGPMIPPQPPGDWKGGSTAVAGPKIGRQNVPAPSEADFRFTVAKGALYAFGYKRPAAEAKIVSLASGKAKVERVSPAGSTEALKFTQTAEALAVTLPSSDNTSRMPYALRIEGSLALGAS
jgi:alpha-L-fucosidase